MAHKNRIGNLFSLTSFGESHGPAVGGVIDGIPAGVNINLDLLKREVARRRPGQSSVVSSRNEMDEVEILSGIKDGTTLGTPIGFIIRNTNQRSEDYSELENVYRPSHADFTYQAKYGIRDYRGGGRSSARETAARVVAGAFAKQVLSKVGISVIAYTSSIGNVVLEKDYSRLDLSRVDNSMVRCPDDAVSQDMLSVINKAKISGDSLGGIVSCVIKGVESGLGEPVFGKLNSQLAEAMMSIPAAKGFEVGLGFDFTNQLGSEVLDKFINVDGKISTATNFSGGIQGGISNGMDIYFNVAFKPVASLMQDVESVDKDGNKVIIKSQGRHDVCVVPRAVPVVEAMAAIVLLDNYLMNKASKL